MSRRNNQKARSAGDYRKKQGPKTSRPVEYQGKLSMTREGFAFLLVSTAEGEAPVDDIFIPTRKLGGALHGDTVKIAVVPGKSRDGRKVEGAVTEILERSARP